MKWYLERQIIAGGFGLAIIILGTVSLISYRNTTQLFERQKRVEHTYEVLQQIRDVLATLRDAERARRGYIITGKEWYLGTYNASIQSINDKFNLVRRSTADNPNHQHRLNIIEPLISRRVAIIKKSVALYKRDKFDTKTQIELTDEGITLHDQVWRNIVKMEAEEQSILRQRATESEASLNQTLTMQLTGFILSFIIICSIYLLLDKQIKKRHQADKLRQNLEKEKELNELKLRFFSMVSHEFRTPLSTILVSAQVLENFRPEWSQEKKIKNLHRIQSAAKTMTYLLTDMLTLTRAEAGKLEFKPERLDLVKFCTDLIDNIEFSYQAQQCIFFMSQGELPTVWLDEKLLSSILGNLLTNAIKYSPEYSHIYLFVTREEEVVIFEVQDKGIGISTEDQSNLFQSFYRGQNVGDVAGTGLGLAVVKKCVELHGGSITVQSQVGVGTTFTVKLPLKTVMGNG
jgi:signal transduction histidine kinase